jgi:hypothetical protein
MDGQRSATLVVVTIVLLVVLLIDALA